MCYGSFGPPFGVPIPPEVHELYSDELKEAWVTFDTWVKQERERTESYQIDLKTAPENVKAAFKLISETPIPGYEEEGITGSDSCYMVAMSNYITE